MNHQNDILEKKDLTLQEVISDYTRYWYLFAIGVISSLVIAFIILRYATSTYETQTTIIIKDEKSGGGATELAAFSELSFFANSFSSKKMESEIVIIKSRNIISKTIEALDLNVIYNIDGAIKSTELYNYKPIKVSFLTSENNIEFQAPDSYITIIDDNSFLYSLNEDIDSISYQFGEIIDIPDGRIIVTPNNENEEMFSNFHNRTIHVFHHSIGSISRLFQSKIETLHDGKNGDVLRLSIKSPLPEKAEDFLNELVFQYNQDAINDKNQISRKTSEFIDSRLKIITKELDSVETNKELFKSSNRLTDIESESNLMMESASEFNRRQVDLSSQIQLSASMIEYLEKTSTTELIPTNISLNETEVAFSVNTFNQLVLERNKLLQNSTTQNPVIKNIDGQLNQLHASILKSLKTEYDKLKLILKDLNLEENKFNNKLSEVPKKEKVFRDIVRQQNIKEQLYLFLLRQREETSISLAVTAPKAKIVDEAISSIKPISPKKSIIYLVALLIGLLIPFIIIYIKTLFDIKINNRRDVEKIAGNIVSIIGEIPRINKKESQLITQNDRSVLAESFRILRTNFQFLFLNNKGKEKDAKSIFVTSTIHSEGKTFVAFNLALSLASINKKVILVGADIRNPQLHRYFASGNKNHEGLTDFIIKNDVEIQNIIKKSTFHSNLDILLSGTIPPNPSELLMLPKMDDLFKKLKENYDYVIVDTAPSMLVADTVLINKYADSTLYVVRASYTDKKLLEFLKDSVKQEKLKNTAIVLNSVNNANFGYGNKYGYTYGQRKKGYLKSIFDSVRKN